MTYTLGSSSNLVWFEIKHLVSVDLEHCSQSKFGNKKQRVKMTNIDPNSEAFVSVEGVATEHHKISSDILIKVVGGFQKIALIVRAVSEGQTYDKRFRPSTELKDRCQIDWGVPFKGSYGLPVSYEKSESTCDLQKIFDIFIAVSSQNLDFLKKLVTDSRLRDKLFEVFKDFLPRPWENWQIKYAIPSQNPAFLDSTSYSVVKSWSIESRSTKQNEILTIKGDLLSIDFEANKIIVRYPPTHRPIECIYLPEIEDSILENRKGQIEVTGKFILDDEGHPTRLTEVSRVQPVDFSVMMLNKLQIGERELFFTPSLLLTPILDEETNQFYIVENKDLGITLIEQTREDLMVALSDQISFLWVTYGCDEVELNTLTKDAQDLREKLRARIKETA